MLKNLEGPEAGPRFESVGVTQRRAKKRLPTAVYGALSGGSKRGRTVAGHEPVFRELGVAPCVAGKPPVGKLGTTLLGRDIAVPVVISPTGVQALHPDGDVAVAQPHESPPSGCGSASKPVKEVVAAEPRTLFPTYWTGDRQVMQRLGRVRRAGADL
jgi:pre-mycofactocin synthase